MSAARPTWRDGVEAVGREAAGVMELHIICREDMLDIFAEALADEPGARLIATAANKLLNGILRAPAASPMICATCPDALDHGAFTLAIAVPARVDATQALGLAVCMQCATSRHDARRKALTALRRLWPDARAVEITSCIGGHA